MTAALVLGATMLAALAVTIALPATRWSHHNPFAVQRLYVNPSNNAANALLADTGLSEPDRKALQVIASQPTAQWFGDWIPQQQIAAQVASYVGDAARGKALPLLTIYAIPGKDCGGQSAGTSITPEQYRYWIDAFATGLGNMAAAIILEPDALAQLTCLSPSQQTTRIDLIKYAVTALSAHPRVSVYIDAGHASWIDPDTMATRLDEAGVTDAAGFSLNVSSFDRTSEEIAYGTAISKRVHGKHFVIDTSRNGSGDAPDSQWCNPRGRSLGASPTAHTGQGLVEAYLWVKYPGISDGACKPGEPPAGTFWLSYAISLYRNRP